VQTLREYGIYNMLQQCINSEHFIKMRVVTYRQSYDCFGLVRCFICFGSYKEGDRLKQFPFCKHLCHIKCLELWMSFEAKCPECNRTYPGLQVMLEYQRATSDLPYELEHANACHGDLEEHSLQLSPCSSAVRFSQRPRFSQVSDSANESSLQRLASPAPNSG